MTVHKKWNRDSSVRFGTPGSCQRRITASITTARSGEMKTKNNWRTKICQEKLCAIRVSTATADSTIHVYLVITEYSVHFC